LTSILAQAYTTQLDPVSKKKKKGKKNHVFILKIYAQLLIYFIFVLFLETVCHYVAQADLELQLLLPQPPCAGISGLQQHLSHTSDHPSMTNTVEALCRHPLQHVV
jgi:hypothetical protein